VRRSAPAQVTFEAENPATAGPVTFGKGGTLELWYTISDTADGKPVTVGGDTVAPAAIQYTRPITVSQH
jgi:hypothetical protein